MFCRRNNSKHIHTYHARRKEVREVLLALKVKSEATELGARRHVRLRGCGGQPAAHPAADERGAPSSVLVA